MSDHDQRRIAELEAQNAELRRQLADRQRLEQQLAERERRWRTILDSEPECVKTLAADGTVLEMNRAGLAMIEADSLAQVLGQCVYSVVVPEHQPAYRRLVERVFQGHAETLEFEVIGLKGCRRWLETHATPLRDESGRIVSLLGVTRDVTERKQAETRLRASEQRFRSLIEHSFDAISLVDPHGVLLYDSPSASAISGQLPEEYLGHSAFDRIHPEDQPTVQRIFADVRQSPGQTRRVQFRLQHKNKSWIWLDATATNLLDEPTVQAIVVNYRDVTERWQTEAALRDRESHLRLIVQTSNVGLWDWNLVTNDAYLSPEWKRQLGYADQEIPNRYEEWLIRLHPDDRAATLQAERDFLAGRRDNYDVEFRLRHRDGSWRWILSSADMLRDPDGRPLRMLGCHVDITARKAAEQALRERELQLRLFVEHSPAAIAMFDQDMRYLVTSRRWLMDYGLGQQDLTGRCHYDVFPEIPDRWKEIHRRCRAGSVETCDEDPFAREDGTLDWVRWEIRPWHKTDGTIGGIIMFTEVITPRKQAEAALRESELRFRTLVEQAADALFVHDFAGRFLDVTQIACESLGYSRDELLTMSLMDVELGVPEEELLPFWNQLSPGQPVTLLGRHRGKDGREFPVEVRVGLIDSEGVRVVLAIVRDISERKQAEAALRANEKRFRALVENSFDAISLVNPDGTVEFVTPAATRILGYSAAEYAQLNSSELMHPDDAGRVRSKISQIVPRPGASVTDVHRMRHRDGSWRWIEGTATNLLHDPILHCVVINFHDITERREAEDELANHRERLAALSRQLIATQEAERRHLARELHDEVGQALTGIKLNLKSLQAPMSAQKRGTTLQETMAVADQTLQQVRNLALDLRPSILDDLGLVAALRWCVDRQSRRAGFQVQFQADPANCQPPPDISTTCFRVCQEALTNIARHANAQNVRVQLSQRGTELELLVQDDGCGFDVLAARERAARSDTLGLLGMEERSQLVGGQVEIVSEPLRGTTIRARFPVPQQASVSE
jgi:PAS domain S-box-containing protein